MIFSLPYFTVNNKYIDEIYAFYIQGNSYKISPKDGEHFYLKSAT